MVRMVKVRLPYFAGVAVILYLTCSGGTAAAQEKVVFLGVDFTHAVFYDEHLLKERAATRSGEHPQEDLISSKIPSWNRESAIFFGHECSGPGVDVDFQASDTQNQGVLASAIKWSPPDKKDVPALTPDLIRQEAKPYVDSSAPGIGILVVVDQVNKKYGVIGQAVVFDRATGEPKSFERFQFGGTGYGLRNYYLNPIKDIVKKACKMAR